MYPGQPVVFSAEVNQGVPENYTWEVEGPIVKDYDDDVYTGNLTSSQNLDDVTYMSAEDFRDRDIKFFWAFNVTDTNRSVSVVAETLDGKRCEDSQDYLVTFSNDDIALQAEDFYVEKNRPLPFSNTTRVLQQHANWHSNHTFFNSSYNDKGDIFFDFHRLYLAHFDKWRNATGYPKIGAWDPNSTLPMTIRDNHTDRGVNETNPYVSADLPSWFQHHTRGQGNESRTITFLRNYTGQDQLPADHPLAAPGGPPVQFAGPLPADNRRAYLNGHTYPTCEEADAPSRASGFPLVQDSLIDFDPDLNLLGCVITYTYHNGRHMEIGNETGDMSGTTTAPKDPIFWRLHKFIDGVAFKRAYPEFTGMAFLAEPREVIPPRVFSQNPFRLNPYITSLPTLSEDAKDIFSIANIPAISAEFTEPVFGVKASDFLVNDSPATKVNGTGAGPYVFIGFEYPGNGPVNVTFASGNITDKFGNHFEGDDWEYVLIDPNQDSDNDGIKDELEAKIVYTDPTVQDTDGDTIPDGIEAVNSCLNPLDNDAHVMNMAHVIINETGRDTDNDGVTNVQEFIQGTDPCMSPEKRGLQLDTKADLQSALPSHSTFESVQPFAIVVKSIGGIAGVNNTLSYDSFTREAVSITNGNETRRQISSSDEDQAIRAINNSDLFETLTSFYPPQPNGADYLEYTVIAIMDGKVQAVYWTDVSNNVPDAVKNLPYSMSNILGSGNEFER